MFKKCKDCSKKALYGYKNLNKEYCKKHKKNNMIYMPFRSRYCISDSCTKMAYFNNYGQKAKFCISHKEEGMINVKKYFCSGCYPIYQPNQIAHMDYGGCLYNPI